MPHPLLTLTTDFGTGSSYVAQLKAVLLARLPELRLVDISHSITPQAIAEAAWLVEQTCPWFPHGTLHLVVVDPGVGTARRIVLLQSAGQRLLGPDNGVFGSLIREHGCEEAWEVSEPAFWAPKPSPTFHGRDIMAPVAAHLAVGLPPDRLGPRIDPATLQRGVSFVCERGERSACGQIVYLDPFGNAVTSIPATALPNSRSGCEVRVQTPPSGEARWDGPERSFAWVTTYAERSPGARIALVGSGGYVELALVQGNAGRDLGLRVGDPIKIAW